MGRVLEPHKLHNLSNTKTEQSSTKRIEVVSQMGRCSHIYIYMFIFMHTYVEKREREREKERERERERL